MSQLKFQPLNLNDRILVIHSNGKCLGDLCRKENGYYDWWPDVGCQSGCWPAYILREIADKLDELNKPWDEELYAADVVTQMEIDASESADPLAGGSDHPDRPSPLPD